eukprot:1162142-Pelagomonas_calceolata.AAC.12
MEATPQEGKRAFWTPLVRPAEHDSRRASEHISKLEVGDVCTTQKDAEHMRKHASDWPVAGPLQHVSSHATIGLFQDLPDLYNTREQSCQQLACYRTFQVSLWRAAGAQTPRSKGARTPF